jgi:hypothetical protein
MTNAGVLSHHNTHGLAHSSLPGRWQFDQERATRICTTTSLFREQTSDDYNRTDFQQRYLLLPKIAYYERSYTKYTIFMLFSVSQRHGAS